MLHNIGALGVGRVLFMTCASWQVTRGPFVREAQLTPCPSWLLSLHHVDCAPGKSKAAVEFSKFKEFWRKNANLLNSMSWT